MNYPRAAALLAALLDRAGETARYPRITASIDATDRHGNAQSFRVSARTKRAADNGGWGAPRILPEDIVVVAQVYAYDDDDTTKERKAGHLNRDGQYHPNGQRWSDHQEADRFGRLFLDALEKDGKDFLFDAGRAQGVCCFCMADLSTPESITAGYGPQCAAKLGLPWGDVPEVQNPEALQAYEQPADRQLSLL